MLFTQLYQRERQSIRCYINYKKCRQTFIKSTKNSPVFRPINDSVCKPSNATCNTTKVSGTEFGRVSLTARDSPRGAQEDIAPTAWPPMSDKIVYQPH